MFVSLLGVSPSGVSLSGVSLSGVSLSGVSLSGVSLSGVSLSGVSLSGLDLDLDLDLDLKLLEESRLQTLQSVQLFSQEQPGAARSRWIWVGSGADLGGFHRFWFVFVGVHGFSLISIGLN